MNFSSFVLSHLQFPKFPYCPFLSLFDTWLNLSHPFHPLSNLVTCVTRIHVVGDFCHITCLSNSFYGTRYPMPRKTCKFRLSRNLTKFDVVARFRKTIPTVVRFVIQDLEKFQIFTKITILPLFRKLEFSRVLQSPLLKRILFRNSTHILIQPRAYVTSHNSKTMSGMITRLRSQLLTTR